MIVGSWPGYIETQNSFLRVFLDGLTGAGCDVVSVDSIDELFTIGELDMLIIHWPQRVFWEASSRSDVIGNMVKLIRGLRRLSPSCGVVWLAHDLRPHDALGLQALLWKPFMTAMLSAVDAVLTMSRSTVDTVLQAYPSLEGRPIAAVRHPSYPDQSLGSDERSQVREDLGFGPGDIVLGYCGQLRHNKGLDRLVDAYQGLGRSPDYRLLVAGHAPGTSGPLVERLEQLTQADRNVRLLVEDLSDWRYRQLIGACDLVVAPFRHYLHSGSLIHALSADRPVLTPRTPFAEDLCTDLGSDWVHLYDGVLTAEVVVEASRGSHKLGRCPLDMYQPERVGEQVMSWLGSDVCPSKTATRTSRFR